MYATVVLPHLDAAYRLALCLTGNPADAEDVVQEACLRALKGINGYAGGQPRAWLLAIVRNAAFTWMARHRPGRVTLEGKPADAEATELIVDEGDTPEAALIAKADAQALDAALASLPTIFREMIVLREYNELSYREISDLMNIPVGTVMSRLARARQHLMRALAPQQTVKSAR